MKGRGERVREAEGFGEECRRAGLSGLDALSDRGLGKVVTDHRSSWVRRVEIGPKEVFVKTYDYPGMRDRVRGLFRNTGLAPSRARREWDALGWLAGAGFAAPAPLLVLERRRHGLLRRAVLVTEAWPGRRVDGLLAEVEPAERDRVLRAVESAVESWHRKGYRDGNLDLRNLLARTRDDGEWEIAKIDAPRFRVVAAGPAVDRWAKADWDRLARSLKEVGLAGRGAATERS